MSRLLSSLFYIMERESVRKHAGWPKLLLQLRSESSPRDSLGPRSSFPSSHHHMEQVLPWVHVPWSIPRMPFSQAAMGSEDLRASSSQICMLSHPGSLVNAQKRLKGGLIPLHTFCFL